MRYWLMKSEPEVYSLQDLQRDKISAWEGVRNYQARNLMRDEMKVGDKVLFYHSNAKPPGVAGLGRVCREAYPDHSAWDNKSKYHDQKCTKENPRWMMVDIEYVETFLELISLSALRMNPALTEMLVLQKGSRLSVQPVKKEHYDEVCRMAAGQA